MKNKKRWLAVVLLLLLILTVLGCGKEDVAEEETSMTIEKGVLKVGVQMGYPPMEYYDADGSTPRGFDMEMAQAIADQMGLVLQVKNTAWDAIFVNLKDDKYDVIVSTVSYTEDRSKEYNLTQTYLDNGLVLVVPKDSDIKELTDLADKKVAVQLGSTADDLMQGKKEQGIPVDVWQYERVGNAFDVLKEGKVDAVCADSIVTNYNLGDAVDDYKIVWEETKKEPICMCLKKGNEELQKEIEAAYKTIKADGTLGEIAKKYFGEDRTADFQ